MPEESYPGGTAYPKQVVSCKSSTVKQTLAASLTRVPPRDVDYNMSAWNSRSFFESGRACGAPRFRGDECGDFS